MIEGLLELIAAMAGLVAMSTGGTVAYVHWRLGRLEQCIDRAHSRLDQHVDRRTD